MSVFGPINTFELQLDRIAKMSGRVQPPRCKTLRNRYPGVKGAAPEPTVKILYQTDDGVVLQCVVQRASPQPKVEWKDSAGNILPAEEPQVTERGGSYDVILRITVTKTDNYSCVVTQKEINHQISADTYVPLNGAAPEPYVTTVKAKDGALLQCAVRGVSPQPKVEWKDSTGKILPAKEPQVTERGGSYDVILQTTVTKTDNYSCVVTQEEIHHQTDSQIYVPVNEAQPQTADSTGLIAAIVAAVFIIVLLLVVLGAVVYYYKHKNTQNPTTGVANGSTPTEDPNSLTPFRESC